MNFPIDEVNADTFDLLREIPDPPEKLYVRGTLPDRSTKLLTVVGSRKYTTYGKQVVDHLIDGFHGYDVGIVSGLALGIDSLAHKAALRNGLYTMTIPGSGIDDKVIYPASHKRLARNILDSGGCLLSEFEPDFRATKYSFIQRNRIMAGISSATLVIEATEQSGTLVTARLASDFNRELLVVPGNIFSHGSRGSHQFLKLGAIPVTSAEDILEILNIERSENASTAQIHDLTDEQLQVMKALHEPLHKDELIRSLNMEASEANILLMQMVMEGLIKESNNIYYSQ